MKSFRLFILLKCIAEIQGERSIFGVYHIFQGKRSSQTIQDAKLFNISYLFQTMRHLSKEDIANTADLLLRMDLITRTREDTYIVTDNGFRYLEETRQLFLLPSYLNGWKFGRLTVQFWKRYSLTIQTLSCLVAQRKTFIPIINDEPTQEWVRWHVANRDQREQQFSALYKETESLLSNLPEITASIFVLHITGSHRIGYTFEQIGTMLKLDEDYAWILFQSALHHIIEQLEKTPNQYPEMNRFIEQRTQSQEHLTLSTQKTYELLRKGKSIEEITDIRNLKMSTIEDHLVEIASEIKSFNIEPYVDHNLQEEIRHALKVLKTKRLKPIKESLNNRVSYFQVRLTLARGNV